MKSRKSPGNPAVTRASLAEIDELGIVFFDPDCRLAIDTVVIDVVEDEGEVPGFTDFAPRWKNDRMDVLHVETVVVSEQLPVQLAVRGHAGGDFVLRYTEHLGDAFNEIGLRVVLLAVNGEDVGRKSDDLGLETLSEQVESHRLILLGVDAANHNDDVAHGRLPFLRSYLKPFQIGYKCTIFARL